MRTRKAFTLVELVVALVILVVLSSIASLSLTGTMDRYQLTRATQTLEMFDARARRDARSSGQAIQTRIDTARGNLQLASLSENRDGRSQTSQAAFRLPRTVTIEEIQLVRKMQVGRSFDYVVNPEGRSVSYAVHFQHGNMSRWIVVIGSSGQTVVAKDKREANEILSL
ncbi:hypothetical protein Pla22_03370 [Rubripirellula amarantea]|uniref:Uncharacterized protein n=1 Tax=Rubripirellula amarantea TaxID=2527999 RepID=A0A5C5WRG6_9BACT|nr:prepilin-type N-terminal cleavage/methylation domain-containing protein [Rubripirellula amarantea]TWT52711.1 hypothetical protein Pla22_03370 [Rubripirellula amarantea]